MNCRTSHHWIVLLVANLAVLLGCNGTSEKTGSSVSAAQPGHFSGRITQADGSPITLPGVKYQVNMSGTAEVGQSTNFRPTVATDGTFSLKLPAGNFYPPYGYITVPFEGKNYLCDLDPVDPTDGARDGAPGIVQNFRWRITGPKPLARNPDVNNATHWYGITIPVLFRSFRADTEQVIQPLPDGSKVTWTLKPTTKLLDGSEAETLTIERKWNGFPMSSMDALNDLPPANYEISAVATLPDGSTKTVLVEEFSERKYKPTMKLILQPYATDDKVTILPAMVSWVVE